MSKTRRLLLALAILALPIVAVADNPVAYRVGPGAQMTCAPSAPNHISTRGTMWCKSTDGNKLYYTDPSGSDTAVGAAGGGSETLQQAYTAGAAGGGAVALTSSGGPLALSCGADANKGLTVKANSTTQSADLMSTLNSAGTPRFEIVPADSGDTHRVVITTNVNGSPVVMSWVNSILSATTQWVQGSVTQVALGGSTLQIFGAGFSPFIAQIDGTSIKAASGFDLLSAGAATMLATATSATFMASGARATWNGPVNVVSQAAPGSPSNGDVWTDSTRLALTTRQDGISQSLSTVLYTGTASATVSTATTATVVGTGVGTLTLPANWCAAGKTVRAHVGGVLTSSGTPGNYTFFFKLGATTIATTGTFTPQATATTKGWTMDALIVFRTCGVSGTVMVDGAAAYPSAAGARAIQDLNNNGGTTTINTTGSLALDAQVTLGSASQTVIGTASSWEVLN